jgi:hypothetical protein
MDSLPVNADIRRLGRLLYLCTHLNPDPDHPYSWTDGIPAPGRYIWYLDHSPPVFRPFADVFLVWGYFSF